MTCPSDPLALALSEGLNLLEKASMEAKELDDMRRENELEDHMNAQKDKTKRDPFDTDYPHIIAQHTTLSDKQVMTLDAFQRLQLRDLLYLATGREI